MQVGFRRHEILNLFGLWLGMRLLISGMAGLYSSLRPIQPLEWQIPFWPPLLSSGWLERAFLSPLNRWDVGWYVRILTEGYHPTNGTASFHPLLPFLARLPTAVGVHPILSLLLVNTAAGLALLLFFRRLAALDLKAEDAQTSVYLLLFSPLAFTLFIPYTEPLFLLWAVLCLLWARQSRWWLAGLAAGLATLTRQHGLFLALPMAWELWEANRRDVRRALCRWRDWASLSLIPLAMGAWLLYRGLALGEVQFDSSQPLASIYALLVSPSHREVVPVYQFLPPWGALALALEKAFTAPDIDIWTNLILASVVLIGLIAAWPRQRASYRLYSLVVIIIALSYHTGSTHPYMGLPRHLWLAFPAWIGLAPLFNRPWKRLGVMLFGLFSGQFLLLQYVLESWVP